jgi:hypothetical protein
LRLPQRLEQRDQAAAGTDAVGLAGFRSASRWRNGVGARHALLNRRSLSGPGPRLGLIEEQVILRAALRTAKNLPWYTFNCSRNNGYKVFLGEIGWSAEASCTPEANAIMNYMSSNADVWLVWAYWTGSPATCDAHATSRSSP